jgi:hypothetical protein
MQRNTLPNPAREHRRVWPRVKRRLRAYDFSVLELVPFGDQDRSLRWRFRLQFEEDRSIFSLRNDFLYVQPDCDLHESAEHLQVRVGARVSFEKPDKLEIVGQYCRAAAKSLWTTAA